MFSGRSAPYAPGNVTVFSGRSALYAPGNVTVLSGRSAPYAPGNVTVLSGRSAPYAPGNAVEYVILDVEINLFEDTLQMQRYVRRSVTYEHYYHC